MINTTAISESRHLCFAAVMVALLMMLGLLCAGQSTDEPLGDLARQNKTAHKPSRILTNDDLPSAAVPADVSQPPANDSDTAQKSNSVSQPVSAPVEKKPEAKNSHSGITVPGVLTNGTLEEARTALETLKHDRQAFITNYDKIERRLSETDNDALRQTYMDILATREKTLARNAQQIADTESAIRAAQDANPQGDNHETQ